MKTVTFWCDVAASNVFEVGVDGDMATKEQLAAILEAVNLKPVSETLAKMATVIMERNEFSKGDGI